MAMVHKYHNLMKVRLWVLHLKCSPKREVGALLSVSAFIQEGLQSCIVSCICRFPRQPRFMEPA